ncbi:MAG: cytidylate kinase-like family protein [Armatimonadota bacterium]|nr:cytidylate kinase-like family protein [Armatimonadota bacterium]
MASRTVITISRQLGSGGSEVGQIVAARMNLKYVDREVLRQAAETLGRDELDLSYRQDRTSSFWEKLVALLCASSPDVPFHPPPPLPIPDEQLFRLQSRIVSTLAEQEDCVIVGQGAAHVLCGKHGSLHVHLHAPEEFRTTRVMEIYSIPNRDQARAMIQNADRDRKAFVAKLSGKDWMCAREYHLCIDSSILPLPDIAEMIMNLALKKHGFPSDA